MNWRTFILSFKAYNVSGYIKIVLLIIGLFILITSIQSYRGAIRAVNKLNNKFQSIDSPAIVMTNHNELFTLLKNEAFLQARVCLAGMDSLGLCINLEDSTICMELKGVKVYDNKMDGFKSSKIFNKMDPSALLNLLSRPLTITADTANIPKERIRTIKAPKNEKEATILTALIVPDTTWEYVAVRLELDSSIVIMIEQDPRTVDNSSKAYRRFLTFQRHKYGAVMCKTMFALKVPEYHPWIKIYLPPDEVKSIFRAMPRKGTVVLKI